MKSFPNDSEGYVSSLKRLKYLFGQRPAVAQALLAKVVKGKPVQDHDLKGLSDFYYSISDCLVALNRLRYLSDIHSSDTLRQTVHRLPRGLQFKWAERSLWIRRREEPNLIHFEQWLQERLLAMKEAYLPESKPDKKPKDEHVMALFDSSDNECFLCSEKHLFWKCKQYKELKPKQRHELAMKKH